jgi:uncharacterized repeat protein (TIGR01451 family)
VRKPAIAVLKTASPGSFDKPGQPIHYSYLVTNTGNVTLHGIAVTDHLAGLSAVTCPAAALPAGRSTVCTASYVTTAADLNAGKVLNTATAKGTPPGSTTPVVSGPSMVTVPAERKPALRVVKSASPKSFDRAGQPIRFSYLVTNTGNVTLTKIHITDQLRGLSAVRCPVTTLPAGKSETCTATYRVTAADLNAGHVTNRATASGNPPGSVTPVVSPPSAITVKAIKKPAIKVVKSATPGTYSELGQLISYRFQVTNTGNVTLGHIAIRDTLRGLSAIRCGRTTLVPGASETCTATYRITRTDLKNGYVTNHAVAEGTPPGAHHPVVSRSSSVTIHEEVPVTGIARP